MTPRETIHLLGHRWSPEVHELKDFLARSRVPYRWTDVEREPKQLEEAATRAGETPPLPLLIFPDGARLARPAIREVAERIGLDTQPDAPFYDLVIVGGGPAGLAAAVYGASEGLRTVVVEESAPGGQAGQSSRIENYLGFPEGVSGADLARRAVAQAERFHAEVLATRRAVSLQLDDPYRITVLDDGTELASHAVLLATGVSYRWLDAPGCPQLVGAGIYYGAAAAEAQAFEDQDIYLLGGGNSAGQAALLFAESARRVVMILIEESLEETMSRYLVDRISAAKNVEVRTGSTIAEAEGKHHLEHLTIERVATGERERVAAQGLYVFIGGTPRTDWLAGILQRDEQGYVLSGTDVVRDGSETPRWPLEREPHYLETSAPGVFVAGDVRHGAVRRLAAAVGEGGIAIQFVHAYTAER